MQKNFEMEMDILEDYPEIELIEWQLHPDYIRIYPNRNDDWYIHQFRFLKEYLHRIVCGWSVADFFTDVSSNEIALYSFTIFTEDIVNDLRRKSGNKIYVSDKNYLKMTVDGMQIENVEICSPKELLEYYKRGVIKKVIVCSIFRGNEIMDELLDMEFALNDVVTLSSILVF